MSWSGRVRRFQYAGACRVLMRPSNFVYNYARAVRSVRIIKSPSHKSRRRKV